MIGTGGSCKVDVDTATQEREEPRQSVGVERGIKNSKKREPILWGRLLSYQDPWDFLRSQPGLEIRGVPSTIGFLVGQTLH